MTNKPQTKKSGSTPLPDSNLRVTRKMSSNRGGNNANGDDVQYFPSFGGANEFNQ